MKRSLELLSFFFVSTFLLLSCQKEYFSGCSYSSYSQKSFSFKNTGQVSLTTGTGLKISFPSNAFVKVSNGQPVNDDITLEVKEILRPDAMILNKMSTVADGLPLESGGEFYLHATSGNEELKLAAGVFVKMELPCIPYNVSGMKVFRGIENPATGEVNWQPNNNAGVWIMPADTLGNGNGSILFSDKIEWINCDKFINEPLIIYSAIEGNCPNIDSTDVYIHLTGRNSVLSLKRQNNIFSSARIIAAPATIVSTSFKNGQLYAAIHTVNMLQGQSVKLDFSPITLESLKARLAKLQ
jgi:hypothetical protein